MRSGSTREGTRKDVVRDEAGLPLDVRGQPPRLEDGLPLVDWSAAYLAEKQARVWYARNPAA